MNTMRSALEEQKQTMNAAISRLESIVENAHKAQESALASKNSLICTLIPQMFTAPRSRRGVTHAISVSPNKPVMTEDSALGISLASCGLTDGDLHAVAAVLRQSEGSFRRGTLFPGFTPYIIAWAPSSPRAVDLARAQSTAYLSPR